MELRRPRGRRLGAESLAMTPMEKYFAAVAVREEARDRFLYENDSIDEAMHEYGLAMQKCDEAALAWDGYDEWKRATEELKGRP